MLIRPRLTDHFGILLAQADLDFAIPFLDEDIPLYVDPFLLWRSPSQMDNGLHTGLINAFNHPSGVAAPSQADEIITARLKEALALIDVRVLDHLIVGEEIYSIAEAGLL